MKEIEQIKERLAKDLCPQSMTILQRAVLITEECEYVPRVYKVEDDDKLRRYPKIQEGLMVNPFPKKKKKGKKKKKKGKK